MLEIYLKKNILFRVFRYLYQMQSNFESFFSRVRTQEQCNHLKGRLTKQRLLSKVFRGVRITHLRGSVLSMENWSNEGCVNKENKKSFVVEGFSTIYVVT
jgi:hypothetical protein